MDLIVETLRELGGTASRGVLLRSCGRRAVEEAVRTGRVRRLARGRYVLPGGDADVQVALALAGVLSHESAALWWGWACGRLPHLPVVTVPRHRKVTEAQRRMADVRYADLAPDEVDGRVTAAVRTVLDCARYLPLGEALAVADAALRDGVTRDELAAAAMRGPRTGRPAARRVVEVADARAANAFESAARAIGLDVPGLHLVPQLRVAAGITPDLVDAGLRIVVECDSWTYHAEKSAFHRDLERYNELALGGWLVLRLDRRHVVEQPAYVRDLLVRGVARRR
jgi:very-short-patch-repair endonuclease